MDIKKILMLMVAGGLPVLGIVIVIAMLNSHYELYDYGMPMQRVLAVLTLLAALFNVIDIVKECRWLSSGEDHSAYFFKWWINAFIQTLVAIVLACLFYTFIAPAFDRNGYSYAFPSCIWRREGVAVILIVSVSYLIAAFVPRFIGYLEYKKGV